MWPWPLLSPACCLPPRMTPPSHSEAWSLHSTLFLEPSVAPTLSSVSSVSSPPLLYCLLSDRLHLLLSTESALPAPVHICHLPYGLGPPLSYELSEHLTLTSLQLFSKFHMFWFLKQKAVTSRDLTLLARRPVSGSWQEFRKCFWKKAGRALARDFRISCCVRGMMWFHGCGLLLCPQHLSPGDTH